MTDVTERNKGLPLKKLTLRQLVSYAADLFILSDNTPEWLKHPRIRLLARFELFSLLILIVIQNVIEVSIQDFLGQSVRATQAVRWFWVFAIIWMILINIGLAYYYYRDLLITGKDLRFKPIFVFWAGWVSLFAMLYRSMYHLKSNLFIYRDPPFVPLPTISTFKLMTSLEVTMHFLTYSACTAFTIVTPRLLTSSFWVSATNLVEVVGNTLLIVVFIATFVGRSLNSKNRSDTSS